MEGKSRLHKLNARYGTLTVQDRLKQVFEEFDPGKILVTTSFGGTSIVLLHLINKISPGHPIYLINTGYLFEETQQYKQYLRDEMGLNIIEIHPHKRSHQFTTEYKVWQGNPDFCCFINKVEPLRPLKKAHDVWISGLLKYQNENRSAKQLFEQQDHLLKFYPILDMTAEEVALYQTIYELPLHPLAVQGYGSIGCIQCTKKGSGREGRWQGTAKTECGLHVQKS